MKLINNWKKHLRSYSAISLFANILIALSFGLSSAFGMGLIYLSPFWVVVVMGIVAGIGCIGKFIKQWEEDEDD